MLETDIISELIQQAPGMAVLASLIFYLIRTLSKQQKILVDQLRNSNEQTNKIISRNSEVIGSTNTVMGHCSDSMEKCADSVDELKLEMARGTNLRNP